MPYIYNLLDQVEAIGWGGSNNSNQNWVGRFNDANIITNVVWVASIDNHTAYLTWSSVNPQAPQRRIHKNSFVPCISRVSGINLISYIPWSAPWFVGGVRTGMFQLLHNFSPKLLVLVQVIVSRSRLRSPCTSFVITVFDS